MLNVVPDTLELDLPHQSEHNARRSIRARRVPPLGRDLLAPVWPASLYFVLLFVVRPVWDVVFGSPFLGNWPFDPDTSLAFELSLAYAALSFISFLVGYVSTGGAALGSFLPRLPATWRQTRSVGTVGLLLLSGAVSLWALITYHGGWVIFTSDRAAALTAPGQEYLRQGTGLIPVSFLYALTLSMGWGRRRWAVVIVGGVTLATLGAISGSKFEALYPILATILTVHYLGGRRIGIRHLAALTLGVVLVFPVFNNLRHADSLKTALTTTHWTTTEVGEHLIARFYGADALTLCVRDTPGLMAFQYGSTITPVLTAWIPRVFFPEKPVVTFGKVFAETYMGDHFADTGTSASPTILGDAYINFHLPGILIVSFAYGLLLRGLYTWTIRSHFGAPAVFLYLGLLPLCVTAWEGAIGSTLVLVAVKVTALLFVIWIAGEWQNDRLAPTADQKQTARNL